MPFRLHLDIFKGLTFLWIIFLMNYFQIYTEFMWLYLFLHGSCGICWVIKDLKFPNVNVTKRASVDFPSRLDGLTHPSPARVAFLVVLYLTGIFLMMGSDYQKTRGFWIRKVCITLRRPHFWWLLQIHEESKLLRRNNDL